MLAKLFYALKILSSMTQQYPKILNQIHETLATYDPDGRSVLIGGAALAYHLNDLGWNTTHTTPDVDVLMSSTDIETLAAAHEAARYKGPVSHHDVGLYPSATSERASLTIPEVGTYLGFSAYSGFVDDLFSLDYIDAVGVAIDFDSHPVIPLGAVLHWKASVGRRKDRRDVTEVLELDGIDSKLSPIARYSIGLSLSQSAERLSALRPTSRYDDAVSFGGHDY